MLKAVLLFLWVELEQLAQHQLHRVPDPIAGYPRSLSGFLSLELCSFPSSGLDDGESLAGLDRW